jgi:peroxiredoxin
MAESLLSMLKNYLILVLAVFIIPFSLWAQPLYGEQPYEISLPTPAGDTVSLSSLKGKVVLIDFWASWCAPCRVANRDLVKIYKKHKENGFEILGVSLDEEQAHWQKAIARDKITWLQVIDPGGWEAKTAAQWKINAIPTNYLINQDGIVVGIDLLPNEINRALSILLKN